MRLLFDQNISYRIINILSKSFPEAKHVNQLGLEGSTDISIWEYAKSNNYTIVTFDSDYYDLSIIKGCPPKIIWLRIGNTTTDKIAKVLEEDFELITLFITDSSYKDLSCLEMG
jgi:predicted nuclease of predicted toxin-antitoxin system